MLAGRPTLRHPGGEDELEPGDIVCFPDGPEGAHKFTNRADETARLMILSSFARPAVAVFPDSDKLGVVARRRRGRDRATQARGLLGGRAVVPSSAAA